MKTHCYFYPIGGEPFDVNVRRLVWWLCWLHGTEEARNG